MELRDFRDIEQRNERLVADLLEGKQERVVIT